MNDLKLWALILGLVAVVISSFVLWNSFAPARGPLEPEPARLELPAEVPGFVLQEALPRVDPLFAGEVYSSHASFVPEPASPFAAAVQRVGLALYHFEAAEAIPPALAILSLGQELTSETFRGQTVLQTSDAAAGQATFFWSHGADLVQVLSVGRPEADGFELTTLESAGLVLLGALIETTQGPSQGP